MGHEFPRTARLTDRASFERVLRQGRRHRAHGLTMVFMPNTYFRARLGLVVPKRQVRRATMRNRIKRIVREAFRLQAGSLQSADMVVLVYREAAELPVVTLRETIDRLLSRCAQRQENGVDEEVVCAIS